MTPVERLDAGEVGYIATGLKDVGDCQVGDTITLAGRPGRRAAARLPAGQADGLRRALPGRQRRVPAAARGAREAEAQRRRRWSTSPRARSRSASASAAASSACCTWRSSGSGSSASTTSTCSITAPSVEYQVVCTTDGETSSIDNPADLPAAEHDRARSTSPGWTSRIIAPTPLHRPDHGAGHEPRRGIVRKDGVRRRAARRC